MATLSKDTQNRSLIYGDFDNDGVPNIDDKYPLDKKRNQRSSELLLTDELRLIRKRALEHKQLFEKTKGNLRHAGFKVKGRIKGTTSIVNKLRRKYLYTIKDFAGIVILVDSQEEAYRVLEYLQNHYNVVEIENYYISEHRTGSYRAIHVLIEQSENYVEIQIKTPEDYKRAVEGHTKYKLSDIQK